MNTTTVVEPLVISRLIKAPRSRVFTAWTTPEMAQWICSSGPRTVISAKFDLRVGGDYHIKINTAEHGDMECSGTYREIKPPSRVVFTWHLGNCMPEWKGLESQVTVEFSEHKDGTLLKLTHEGLPTAEVRDKHSGGWNVSLDNLEKLA